LNQEVPGITIPDAVMKRMEKAGPERETEGVAIAVEMIAELREIAQGVYIMPAFGRYDLAAELIDRIKTVDKSSQGI
jgi:methionine synthase / methylenetetrahydrofolate reductase(NADPH)